MPVRTVIAAVLAAVAIGGLVELLSRDAGYEVSAPSRPATALDAENAAGLALRTSNMLFERASVVVIAGSEHVAAQARAAPAAVSLGAPMLLMPPGGDPTKLAHELERLRTQSVLVFGGELDAWAEDLPDGLDLVQAPAGREGLERVIEGESNPELPVHEPSGELEGLMFLVDPGRAGIASAATARAAGAQVVGALDADPRANPDVVATLSDDPPDEVVAATIGDSGGEERLRRRLEVAATGVELPGGGQVLFPHRRMVALYGHPETPDLGALGDQPRRETINRAERLAAEYRAHSDVAVIPALEIIATIASQEPGDDGSYSMVTPVEELRPWIDDARRVGVYVVLDLQPGRTDFLTQARHYEELLAEPHVGLALDPEWRLDDDQVHLDQIGSVDAEEINTVIDWLAALARNHMLPQKLLLLHQFELNMITDRERIDTSHDELAVLLHADGHGTPELKRATWDALNEAAAPPGMWWGWKNFYDEDAPMWTPEQTMEIHPPPFFISYQ